MINSFLNFSERLKETYTSTRKGDEAEYSQTKEKSNQQAVISRIDTKFMPQASSALLSNPFENLSVFTPVDPKGGNMDSIRFRDSSRSIQNRHVNIGYMGMGSGFGDIDVSSTLRNNEFVKRREKEVEVENLTDHTFQIFNPEELKRVAPQGPNGVELHVRGGSISRHDEA